MLESYFFMGFFFAYHIEYIAEYHSTVFFFWGVLMICVERRGGGGGEGGEGLFE